jgi:hypothetical protein
MSKNNKNKGKAVQQSPISPAKYIQQFGRNLKLDACFVNAGWKEDGMASIFVVRRKKSGKIVFGSYLVDIRCLGLKDTAFKLDYSDADFEAILETLFIEPMEPIDSTLAFNLIYGGIEYAEDLGFEPNKNFNITQFLLPPVEEVPYVEFEFGKDGKPFYVSSQYDNVAKNIAILDKSVGRDGYVFIVRVDR